METQQSNQTNQGVIKINLGSVPQRLAHGLMQIAKLKPGDLGRGVILPTAYALAKLMELIGCWKTMGVPKDLWNVFVFPAAVVERLVLEWDECDAKKWINVEVVISGKGYEVLLYNTCNPNANKIEFKSENALTKWLLSF